MKRWLWLGVAFLAAMVLLLSGLGNARLLAQEGGDLRQSETRAQVSLEATGLLTSPITMATEIYLPLLISATLPFLTPPLPPPVPVSSTAVVDFDMVREALRNQGQDLSFVKIGFHAGPSSYSDGLDEWMASLDAAGVPFFLKSVDNAEPLLKAQNLMAQSGISHTLVFRSTAADVPEYSLPPQLAAELHWERHKALFPPELDPSLVWLETVNEVDKARSEWLGQFALATAELALKDGYRWAAFGWSSGEPEEEHWESPSMLAYLRLAAQHPQQLAVALHEYSYVVEDVARGYPFLLGRFQYLFQVCDAHRIPRPTVLITEWGWAYQDVPSPAEALEHIRWASWLYGAYPQVKGAAIWYLGPGFGGIAEQVQHLILPLRDYALHNYFVIDPGFGAAEPALFLP